MHALTITSEKEPLLLQAQAHLAALNAKSKDALAPHEILEVKKQILQMASFLQATADELQ